VGRADLAAAAATAALRRDQIAISRGGGAGEARFGSAEDVAVPGSRQERRRGPCPTAVARRWGLERNGSAAGARMGSGGLAPLLRVRQAAADKDFESGSGTAVSPISAMTARVASAGRAVVSCTSRTACRARAG